MSARERNAARYRLDDGLNAWHYDWVLEGNAVMCVGCGAGQPVRCADLPFTHVAGCDRASEFAKHPWRELAQLLHALPPVSA